MKNSNESLISMPGEWALKRAFGPALEELGEDLRRLYAAGRDKILTRAYQKVEDPNDGQRANLRVTRDVLWNGAVAQEDICTEYFSGLLAASRSSDGRDDSAVEFVDAVKCIASRQLLLHYFIYSGLNQILHQSQGNVNVQQSSDIQGKQIYFSAIELDELGIELSMDFNVLFRHGLLHAYKYDVYRQNQPFVYASANPTTYGVLLFAASHNKMHRWNEFSETLFGPFPQITLPQHFAPTLGELAKALGADST
ncbi:MAG: hypothetical protein F4174_13250 [Acidobacteria bacterium]|nr:hypothetical protein [Acidobacteriota bacterium]